MTLSRQITSALVLFVCFASLASVARSADDEVALRATFTKQFKDKNPQARIEAVKSLAGIKQEKSVVLLVTALKDSSNGVRKAAVETLESAGDGAGVAVKPLCAILANKKESIALRLAAATTLSNSSYKADPIKAYIIAITIEEGEVELYDFGYKTGQILTKFAGEDFGLDKDTPGKWANWYKANEGKLVHEDQHTLAAYKKSVSSK